MASPNNNPLNLLFKVILFFSFFFAYLRTYKLTDMKKLILLIVLAAAALRRL